MANVQHSTQTGVELHEDKRIKEPCRAASTGNITLSAPGTTIDGVAMVAGDRFLAKDQTLPAQNGIYVWSTSTNPATRASDATTAADFVYLFHVGVREGALSATTEWIFSQTAALTIGTTALTFTQVLVFNTEISGTDFKAAGLTGATSASRYVGATTGGPPASGTFVLGDFVIDRSTAAGAPFGWKCTVGGTSGTWVAVSTNPMTTVGDLIIGGTVANGYAAEARLAAGTSTFVLTSNGAAAAPSWQAAGSTPYINIQDQKTQNTAGGTFTSGSFQTRALQTVQTDSGSIASLTSNQITLPAGTYDCAISAPAGLVGSHQTRLQNITDTTTLLTGTTEYSSATLADAVQTRSWIVGRFTLAGSKALEVQHRCTTTRTTNGFGIAGNFTTEVYTVAEFHKVG